MHSFPLTFIWFIRMKATANSYEIIITDTRYYTLNMGYGFITLGEPCNNLRPRCHITWPHVTNHLYHGFSRSIVLLLNTENRGINITSC